MTASNETVSSFKNATILHHFTSRAFWQTLSSDIFAGQIIASLIVLIFVAVFLLREWISQNARPGVFEEDEIAGIPPQDPPVPNLPPPNRPVQDMNARLLVPQRQGPLDPDLEARRQARPWRLHRPIPANARFDQRRLEDERPEFLRDPIRRPQNPHVDPPLVLPLPVILPPEDFGTTVDTVKGKEKEDVTADSVPVALDVRRRMRKRFNDGNESTEPVAEAGPSFAASDVAPSLLEPVSGRSSVIGSTPFEFTFKVPGKGDSEEDIREPVPEMPAPSLIALQTAMMTGTPVSEEEPRRRSIVLSPDLLPRTPTPRLATQAMEDETDVKLSLDSSPLTSSDLSFIHLSVSNSSLAVEDAPYSGSLQDATPSEHLTAESSFTSSSDELMTDSSSFPAGNIDRKKRTRDEMEEEFEHYFRDPQPSTSNPVDAAHRSEPDHVTGDEEQPPMGGGPDDEDDSEDDDEPERMFWDADADREDEDEEDEDPLDIGDFNVANNRQGPQPQPPAQGPIEPVNDAADDLEAAVEDDMEGALEGTPTLHN